MIAGHTFAETPAGRICACGRRWADILSVTREDVGQLGIAHVEALNEAGRLRLRRSGSGFGQRWRGE